MHIDTDIQNTYNKCMSKTINISLPEQLLKKIDAAAKSEYASRSDFIRETIVRRLKGQRIVDEWGDPIGEWNEGIDLRDEHGRGVPAKTLLKTVDEIVEAKPDERQNKKVSRKA
jgi:Arc/MetJ-type ribon-helix-helix transcriptional regulator